MEQGYHNPSRRIATVLGAMDVADLQLPGAAHFPYRRAGRNLNVGAAGFQHLIAVNQVESDFFNEMRVTQQLGSSQYPRNGAIKKWDEYLADWRNCRPDAIKAVYDDNFAIDAALAINEGSQPPHLIRSDLGNLRSGGGRPREWTVKPPYTGDNGLFFKADTMREWPRPSGRATTCQSRPDLPEGGLVARWGTPTSRRGPTLRAERGPDAPHARHSNTPIYASDDRMARFMLGSRI